MSRKKILIIDNKKQCTKCFEFKDLACFSIYKSDKTRYHSWCKDCEKPVSAMARDRYQKTEKFKKYWIEYNKNNSEKLQINQKKYYESIKGKINHLKKRIKRAKKEETIKKLKSKLELILNIMYNATYLLPAGSIVPWQTTAAYQSKADAEADMKFHSQGRIYLVWPDNDQANAIAPYVGETLVYLINKEEQIKKLPQTPYTKDLLSEITSAIVEIKSTLCYEE